MAQTAHQGPHCPRCGGETVWEKQDVLRVGGSLFVERIQMCPRCCDWYGDVAYFPARVAEGDLVVQRLVIEGESEDPGVLETRYEDIPD